MAISHDDAARPALVLDAGTGLRQVTSLLGGRPFAGTILLTHLHWDHVHGLPFFRAGDRDDARVTLLLPAQESGESAAAALARGMSPPHFPIGPEGLRGDWTFGSLVPGPFKAEGFTVEAREVPHKGGRTYGYRVSDGHSVLTYIPDHCPTVLGPGPEGLGEYHPAALDLAAGTDLLIHDAFLLAAEVPAEAAFGHAAAEYAAGLGAPRRGAAGRAGPPQARPDRRRAGRARPPVQRQRSSGLRHVRRPGDLRGRRGRDTRPMSPAPAADAIVVGSGPNGLAAAITLARAGLRVQLIEGADTPGGGCRTAELTLPGFRHDVCSAVHPLAASSPFFTSIDLAARGVTLCTPKVAFAHPQDGGRAAAVAGSVEETAGSLGRDAGAYRRLLGPLVREVGLTLPEILAPIRSVPRHPLAMARFGLDGLPPATIAGPAVSHRGSPGPVRRGGRALDAAAERPGDQRVRATARRWRRTRWAGR